MSERRRWLVPVVLLIAVAASGAVAVGAAPDRAAARRPVRIGAPLLGARRVPGAVADAVADARLRRALDGVLADPAFGGAARDSCLMVSRRGHRVVERNPAASLIPASNLKLITAMAALDRLGAGMRYTTALRARRPAAGGVVDGDVWLVGGGDPVLLTAGFAAAAKYQPELRTEVEGLAAAVRRAGVTEIRGRVIGDEHRYDRVRYIPTWRSSYLASAEIGPASALSLNDGFAAYSPGKVASPAPATTAAAELTALLRAHGVTVTGAPGEGRAPEGVDLASVASPPLREVLGEMIRDSDNLSAELVVKELGFRARGRGTTADGLAVVREAVQRATLPVADLRTVDGSGLDRSDRATCRLVLSVIERDGRGGALAAGMSIAGRSGTLSPPRFAANPARGRLRAKTGALAGVVALSGWIDATDGSPVAFALIANAVPSEPAGRLLQERLGAALARYPDRPERAALAPAP